MYEILRCVCWRLELVVKPCLVEYCVRGRSLPAQLIRCGNSCDCVSRSPVHEHDEYMNP